MLRSVHCTGRIGGCLAEDRNFSFPGSRKLPPRSARLSSRFRSSPAQPIRALEQDLQHQRLDIEEEKRSGGFLERLARAWEILFPPEDTAAARPFASNAEIAKQRLKMILISDRCSITDDAKKKIVTNIVGALADFVEIESEEKVQLNVLADPELGTVYSVTVPVRRVKPEYQEFSKEIEQGLEYQPVGDSGARTVAIKLEES
ncbi:hypothetical protein SELMODRAFT_405578 [Selaginella moellendorffii]|uniref:Plastid division regulator MinE n=1 Tax=Selaginella moellendorffii TaxID=88036 RepID=D8QZ14_SELML|nr:uncharacterized protein LOC9655595 [Selaginella moellendorffii]EFJ34709.1 hypothetical protein SELMODRAFT_405578 [Selaginella moellendorffii]|eukprot:XP_002964376.1 uncharacterized protein LOC9655595 [Selaginella moellendorffii]